MLAKETDIVLENGVCNIRFNYKRSPTMEDQNTTIFLLGISTNHKRKHVDMMNDRQRKQVAKSEVNPRSKPDPAITYKCRFPSNDF